MKPILIIGAGLSGLACALTLERSGRRVLLLEKRENIGGRVTTKATSSGFLVDEGFQVLLTSYPELRGFVDLKNLELQSFNSGALIFNGKHLELLANPFRHPFQSLKTLQFSSASLKDKALVVKLMAQVLIEKHSDEMGTRTTLDFLRDFGFSKNFIDDFWIPFLTGVYLDPSLSVGSGFFKFLMNCFAWGEVTLPLNGMNQLPLAMSRQLSPESIKLSTCVKSWNSHGVSLENGETIDASAVVCAFDPKIKEPNKEKHFRSATTYYFTSEILNTLGWDKWLILVPPRFGFSISHLALVSSVASGYTTTGKPLLSVTVTGEKRPSENEIMAEVEKIAQKSLRLTPIAITEVPNALPILEGKKAGFEIKEGIWFCGDRFSTPSINGALRSGRLAAESILSTLKNHSSSPS